MKKNHSPNYLSIEFAVDRASALRMLKDIEPDGIEKGHPVYSIATFAKALEMHRARNASNANDGGSASDTSSLTQARVRIATASAEAKERQNRVAMGQLVAIEPMCIVFGQILGVLHQNLLVLPGKIADSLTPFSPLDRGEIMSRVRKETYGNMEDVRIAFSEMSIKNGGSAIVALDGDSNPIIDEEVLLDADGAAIIDVVDEDTQHE
jgi:hypothetical protein